MSKKILDFYMNLDKMDTKEGLEKYLLLTLSPVIGGVKPSSTITLSYGKKEYFIWQEYKKEFLKEINLKEMVLRKGSKAEIILVYNEESLLNCINKIGNRCLLEKLGYEVNLGLRENLERLMERYDENHCPHELGIFLGIPIEDVIDFMECTEKKCLMCGYWKVYNNCNIAKNIFESYDRLKRNMILSIERSHDLRKRILEFNKISA